MPNLKRCVSTDPLGHIFLTVVLSQEKSGLSDALSLQQLSKRASTPSSHSEGSTCGRNGLQPPSFTSSTISEGEKKKNIGGGKKTGEINITFYVNEYI